MKTKKQLLQEKLNKMIRGRQRAILEKDWLRAADLEIRIDAVKAMIDHL